MRVEDSCVVLGGTRRAGDAGDGAHLGGMGVARHCLLAWDSSAVVQPPAGWASLAAEVLAETLVELAEGFDCEAKHGGEHAVGLSVAAVVLRDRAAESLIAHLHLIAPGDERSAATADRSPLSRPVRSP